MAGSLWGPRRPDALPLVTAIGVARDIDAGTKLTDELLVSISFPAGHLPPGVGVDRELFVGRVVNRSIGRQQLLYPSDVEDDDSALTLQSKIPPGMRGYTIPLNSPSAGLADFALPGSRVDVLSSPQVRRGEEAFESVPIVEGVLVLAVDDVTTPEDVPSSPKSMMLLVSPTQASKLDQAQSRGPLRLALRNLSDEVPPQEAELSADPESPPSSVISQASAPSSPAASISQISVMVLRETVPTSTVVRQIRHRQRPPKTKSQTIVSRPTDR